MIPLDYDLTISAFFDPKLAVGQTPSGKYFSGNVKIDVSVTSPTYLIYIHAHETMQILDVQMRDSEGAEVEIYNRDRTVNQLYRIVTRNTLAVGDYQIEIDFGNDYGPETNLVGFYMSKYVEDGLTKSVVATKFEPTDARKAFPCFDEPGLKATYTVTIVHPAESIALSNWPTTSGPESIENDRLLTKFAQTDRMSTYLISWAIIPDDFGFIQGQTEKDNKTVTIYARKNAKEAGLIDFALEVAVASLDFFENEYFNISDAVPPKIDLIALPNFPSGAMEHWGLIGFRETSLLYSDQSNSLANKQSVAFVIAHELAHFWFGNLVTCEWWDELWLNEAMARFLQFKAVDAIYPDWKVNEQFLTLYMIPVLYDDAFINSHSVAVDVQTPDQINTLFDSITYDKGSSLLRMLEAIVGEENFRDALRNFISKNKFQPANSAEFYSELILPGLMNSTTAEEFMNTWLKQKNYPLVTIELEQEENTTLVNFTQSRYLLSAKSGYLVNSEEDVSPYNYRWMIYLQCTKVRKSEDDSYAVEPFEYFLTTSMETGQLDLEGKYDWVKCNRHFDGFYATDYSEENFKSMAGTLNLPAWDSKDVSNFIHSVFTLAYYGSQSYDLANLVTEYLETGTVREYVPWRTFTWHISKMSSLLDYHLTEFTGMQTLALKTAQNLRDENSGFDIWTTDGSHTDVLLKSILVDFVCRFGDAECNTKVRDLFSQISQEYFGGNQTADNPVTPNLRASVYRYNIFYGGVQEDWELMKAFYINTVDPQERLYGLRALCSSTQNDNLNQLLENILDTNPFIRSQELLTTISYISTNPGQRQRVWDFVKLNWDRLISKFGSSSRTLGSTVKGVCDTFDTDELFEDMQTFFTSTQAQAGAGELGRKQALEIAKTNIFWVQSRMPDLASSLLEPAKKI